MISDSSSFLTSGCVELDTLLGLAIGPRLFLPGWTDQIMVDVSRNLQENFGVTAEQA